MLTLLLAFFLLFYIGGMLDKYEDDLTTKIVENDNRIKHEENI